MSADEEYFPNYRPYEVYIGPQTSRQKGRFVSMADEIEKSLGDVQISENVRVGIKAFYVPDRNDYSSFKIIKLKKKGKQAWQVDSAVSVSNITMSHISAFLSLLNGIEFQTSEKTRLNLSQLNVSALGAILSSSSGADLVKRLSESPELEHDIIAVEEKRRALVRFDSMLQGGATEAEWQHFFESNTWIFGYGLDYKFLHKVDKWLETQVVGPTFQDAGRRADALVHTKAAISQLVFIEIKKADTSLIRNTEYRTGCWAVSNEISGAVAQIQKTVDDFQRRGLRSRLKDENRDDTDQYVYAVDPKSYLVAGNLHELAKNEEKMQCFELFRRNVRNPEILTFDELYSRAEHILERISPDKD